jgi:hypothetical protein
MNRPALTPTTRALSALQWLGFLGGGSTWAAQHVLGYGIAEARCSVAGTGWGIALDTWEGALLGCAAALILGAEAAALTVFLRTRAGEFGDGPLGRADGPDEARLGRLHFFSAAALVLNALFLVVVLLDGSASIVDTVCRQS